MSSCDVAERIRVDPKTVERWITQGRLPHRTHRVTVAQLLNVDEAYLWPEVLTEKVTQSASTAELLGIHPSRSALPHATWQQLINGSREALDVLVYAGTFLIEQHNLAEVLHEKSRQGVHCRILIGDETSEAVRQRAVEEGTAGGLEGRIQLNRRYLRDVLGLPGVEVRTHGTTLYNSLFRFDQDLLVNGHVFGAPAGFSPVLHLRRVPGGRMWDHYMRSFEHVWETGVPETAGIPASAEKAS
ncbi:transcriptional regulator [Pseudonocardia sp. CNS-004]|nr:transcriptional regulator [Pseudonocardia sp. CNS-004]